MEQKKSYLPKIMRSYSKRKNTVNLKERTLVSFIIGVSSWIKTYPIMRKSLSLLVVATILKLSIGMPEPHNKNMTSYLFFVLKEAFRI